MPVFSQENSKKKERPKKKPLPIGLLVNDSSASPGYTLYSPMHSSLTLLIDINGKVVHYWQNDYNPISVYLLPSGNLLYLGRIKPPNSMFDAGGKSGVVQEVTWDGDLVWEYEYSSLTYCIHHDIKRLPNGNTLMIAWEMISKKDAIAAGRNPDAIGMRGLWPDKIIEVKPTGKETGEIVWQWRAWDHIVQDFDPRKKNTYKKSLKDSPRLININPDDWKNNITGDELKKLKSLGYVSSRKKKNKFEPDFTHINSVDYNATHDQIVLSVLGFSELWVIDHSTTTAQAASHSGGRYGVGGDLLFRWGNAFASGQGALTDQVFFSQHNVHWIEAGKPGAGNFLLFNNGLSRPLDKYSTIIEIGLGPEEDGVYTKQSHKIKPVWEYQAPKKKTFYSEHISGVQRLLNGNTFICEGAKGNMFEVTPAGKIVWQYVSGIEREYLLKPKRKKNGQGRVRLPKSKKPRFPRRSVFRATKIMPGFSGLKGKTLTPTVTVSELLKKAINSVEDFNKLNNKNNSSDNNRQQGIKKRKNTEINIKPRE